MAIQDVYRNLGAVMPLKAKFGKEQKRGVHLLTTESMNLRRCL